MSIADEPIPAVSGTRANPDRLTARRRGAGGGGGLLAIALCVAATTAVSPALVLSETAGPDSLGEGPSRSADARAHAAPGRAPGFATPGASVVAAELFLAASRGAGKRSRLYRLDTASGELTLLGSTGFLDVAALGFGSRAPLDGCCERELYGIGRRPGTDGRLWVLLLDTETGRATALAELALSENAPQPAVVDMAFKPSFAWNLFVLADAADGGASFFKVNQAFQVVHETTLPGARSGLMMLLRRAVVADGASLEAYDVPGIPSAFRPVALRGRSALRFEPAGAAGPVRTMAKCGVGVGVPAWAFVERTTGRDYFGELRLENNAHTGVLARRFGTRLDVRAMACR